MKSKLLLGKKKQENGSVFMPSDIGHAEQLSNWVLFLKLLRCVTKYEAKWRTSLRLWEDNGWINSIDPYGWFQWYFRYWLGRRSEDDKRQINRWKTIVSRFKGKLVKMIKDAGGKFDDYSISPKIRQILLHWSYELWEKDFFNSTN